MITAPCANQLGNGGGRFPVVSAASAYSFAPGGLTSAGAAGVLPISGNFSTPNPSVGAWITYNVTAALPAAEKLVLTISDNAGKQMRRCELDRTPAFADSCGT